MLVVQLTPGGVFHAVERRKGRTVYDEVHVTQIGSTYRVGRYDKTLEYYNIPHMHSNESELEVNDPRIVEGEVTCKACRKKLQLDPKPKPSCKRYFLYDKTSNKYYRKKGYRDEWVDDPMEATMYKVHYPPYWAKRNTDKYEMKTVCIYFE